MTQFSGGDWIFIAGVMVVIFFLVAVSGMWKR
jgi:hypothetical protein